MASSIVLPHLVRPPLLLLVLRGDLDDVLQKQHAYVSAPTKALKQKTNREPRSSSLSQIVCQAFVMVPGGAVQLSNPGCRIAVENLSLHAEFPLALHQYSSRNTGRRHPKIQPNLFAAAPDSASPIWPVSSRKVNTSRETLAHGTQDVHLTFVWLPWSITARRPSKTAYGQTYTILVETLDTLTKASRNLYFEVAGDFEH